MKTSFFLKIWLWPLINKRKKKGSVTLVASLLFIVFTTLGLGILYLSQISLRISAYKRNSILLDYASENGIKQGFDHLLSLLSQSASPFILSLDEVDRLREDALAGGLKLINQTLGSQFPIKGADSWENLNWHYNITFHLEQFKDQKDYFQTIYRALISSKGNLVNFKSERLSSLDCQMDLMAGYLPLPLIPLLIDEKLTPEQQNSFVQDHNLEIKLPPEKKALSPVSFSDQQLLPQQAEAQLLQALKIKLFFPQDLSPARLRRALGLEESTEPIPPGVYLIKDDLGLGGIFVQGDLQEMFLAVEEDFQVISFLSEQGKWQLRFSPQKSKTFFSTPTENVEYELIPLGIIIVNGKIHSLGGGIVSNSGEIKLSQKEKIPAILQGLNLTIISSDEITISSHLIRQGIKWQNSIPYLKQPDSQLFIMATGKDFLEDKEKAGEIVIDRKAPQDLEIQASLTASGKGFAIDGADKIVNIEGSLQTTTLFNQSNRLKIIYNDQISNDKELQNLPRTNKPILYLASFQPLSWKEYKEENK